MKKFILLLALVMTFAFASMAGAQSGPSAYSSGFQVQNLDQTGPAAIQVTFYKTDGVVEKQTSDTVAAGKSVTYYPISTAAGFNGSAVISADRQIAAITNVLGDGVSFGASYGGFDSGANEVSLPLIMKNNSQFYTWFNVQNAGSATTNVTVTYAGTTCTETKSIPAGAAAKFDQATNTCLPDKYVGAAKIKADAGGSVVATVIETGPTTLFAYNGFTTGTTAPVIPLVNANNSGFITGISVQNAGTAPTDVTITYTPSVAGAACTEKHTIAAGAAAIYALYGFSLVSAANPNVSTCAFGAKFIGSAAVTANSGAQKLVVIVNQLNIAGKKASSYNAFDTAQASSEVVAPLIMDRNSGFYTGVQIMNVGDTATTVTCTFTNAAGGAPTTYTTPSLAKNQADTHLQLNFLANGFVGSASCKSADANGKLIGVVNELGSGAGDQLFSYEGFNK